MKPRNRAIRVLERCGVDQMLIGDLVEQERVGKSALWLWRQTCVAIAHRIAAEVRRDPLLAWYTAFAFAAGWILPWLWMQALWHIEARLDSAWYPASYSWLAHRAPDWMWRLVVFLHPWAWTISITWCAIVGAAAWLLVRLQPAARGAILIVFTLSSVAPCLPSFIALLVDWLHDPTNPIWFSIVLWNAVFVFVAIPFSIYACGRAPAVQLRALFVR
jgi:hypothetical protein